MTGIPRQRREVDRTCTPGGMSVTHEVQLPVCCPVSRNPRPGSILSISYEPSAGRVVDVYDLTTWIGEYVGGHPSGTRSMEDMVRELVVRCAAVVQAPISGRADLIIDAGADKPQRMVVEVQA